MADQAPIAIPAINLNIPEPITAALALAKTIVETAKDIYDNAPDDLKKEYAGDQLRMLHNCSTVILALQDAVNKALGITHE